MMHWYIKHRIRRAVERHEALPRWIQRRLDSDSELQRYAEDYARMMRQLSLGIGAWMAEKVREIRPGWSRETNAMLRKLCDSSAVNAQSPQQQMVSATMGRQRFLGPPLRWAACIIAIALLTAGMFSIRERPNQSLSQKESARNAERALVATQAVWDQGHRVADQSRVVWERMLDKVSRNLVDRIGNVAVAPIEDSGRMLGVAIHELRKGAVRERDGMIEMSKRFKQRFEESKPQNHEP